MRPPLFLSLLTLSVATALVGASTRGGSEPAVPAPERGTPAQAAGGETGGTGLGESTTWADVDADGRLELLVVAPDGGLALIQDAGGGHLVDRTAELGLAGLPSVARALWHDVDGDAFPDLLVLSRDGTGRLLRNAAGAGFVDVSATSGLELGAGLRGAEWQDVDGDGHSELMLASARGLRLYRHLDGTQFVPGGEELPLPLAGGLLPVRGGGVATHEERAPEGAAPGSDANVAGADPAPASLPARGADGRRALEHGAALSEGAASGATTPGGAAPLLEGSICAHTVRDLSNGMCLGASSKPALGKLYPITSDLFVEAGTGHVGVGTTNPAARLDVDANGTLGLAVSTTSEGPSAATFSSPNTDPAIPTISAFCGEGGSGAYFENRISVGDHFFGFPLDTAVLGLDELGAAELFLKSSRGTETVELVSEEGAGNGAQLELRTADGTTTVSLDAEVGSLASRLEMFTRSGVETVELTASEGTGNGAQLVLRKDNGIATVVLDAETDLAADVSLRNSTGLETIQLLAEEVAGDGAQIVLRKADGTPSIVLDAEQGTNGRITTDTLEITGGADLVESFQTNGECLPGSVVAIDVERPGELVLASEPYDRKVAGIVSGAGGVRPGLHLGQRGMLEGDTAIALTGRVFVRCTDENGPIQPGDLLTSSSTAGCAMRASDSARTPGAVIGKAMGRLEDDQGLVLVLVGLQ